MSASEPRSPIAFLKEFWKRMSEDDISGLSAELAYRYFLSFVPFLIFLTALSALVASMLDVEDPAREIVRRVAPNLPSDAAEIITSQLERVLRTPNGGILSVTFAAAILSANAATSTLLKAIGRIYSVEDHRSFGQRQLMSIGLVVFGGAFLLLVFLAIMTSEWYVRWIVDAMGLASIAGAAFRGLAMIVALVTLFFAIAAVHRLGSDNAKTFREMAPGAVLSAVGWVAATYLFSVYVTNFGSYSNTYGALGGIVILLLWFYLSNMVILLGAELNDVRSRRR